MRAKAVPTDRRMSWMRRPVDVRLLQYACPNLRKPNHMTACRRAGKDPRLTRATCKALSRSITTGGQVNGTGVAVLFLATAAGMVQIAALKVDIIPSHGGDDTPAARSCEEEQLEDVRPGFTLTFASSALIRRGSSSDFSIRARAVSGNRIESSGRIRNRSRSVRTAKLKSADMNDATRLAAIRFDHGRSCPSPA